MKKLLLILITLVPCLAFAQGTLPDYVRTKRSTNTIVDWDLKAKTFNLPHRAEFALAGAQDSTGQIMIKVGADTTLGVYIKGWGWLKMANKRDIVPAGALITASNGLTKVGNDIQLGGAVTNNINLNLDYNTFVVSGIVINPDAQVNQQAQFSVNPNSGVIDLYAGGYQYGDRGQIQASGQSSFIRQVTDIGQGTSLNFTPDVINFSSNKPGFKGVEYDADYESNFSNRSLVTKQFVTSQFGNLSGNNNWTGNNNSTGSFGAVAFYTSPYGGSLIPGDVSFGQYVRTSSIDERPKGLMMLVNGKSRWSVISNSDTESSGNLGSNFNVNRFADAGTLIDVPLSINRATGVANFLYRPTINGVEVALLGGGNTWSGNQTFTNGIFGPGYTINGNGSVIFTSVNGSSLTTTGSITAGGNVSATGSYVTNQGLTFYDRNTPSNQWELYANSGQMVFQSQNGATGAIASANYLTGIWDFKYNPTVNGTALETALTFNSGLTRTGSTVTINQGFTPTWTSVHNYSASILATANGAYSIGSTTNNFSTLNANNLYSNGALTLGTTNSNSIIFTQVGSEKGRFSANGNFLLGSPTDDNVNKLQVTGSAIFTYNDVRATTNIGFTLANATAATAAIPQQNSGRLRLTASGWNTTTLAPFTHTFDTQLRPFSTTSNVSNVYWSINNVDVFNISSNGVLSSSGGYSSYAAGANAAYINTASTGTIIQRNIADGNLALTVNGIGSTGTIFGVTLAGANRFSVDYLGAGVLSGNLTIGTRLGINSNNQVSASLFMGGNQPFGTSGTFGLPGFGIRQDALTYTSTTATGTIANATINGYASATYASSSATTLTNAYGNYFQSPIAGTNVTITNNWVAGFAGNVNVLGKIQATTDFEATTIGNGYITKSPNGTRWRLTVSDAGASVWTSL